MRSLSLLMLGMGLSRLRMGQDNILL
nr:hypothetical protein [Tanacetum cinerariifolium]